MVKVINLATSLGTLIGKQPPFGSGRVHHRYPLWYCDLSIAVFNIKSKLLGVVALSANQSQGM